MTVEAAPWSERAQAASAGEIHALLGRTTVFEGKLTFEGKVRIDGNFKGEVFSDGTLILGEDAVVEAEIEVGTLIVRGGTLRGNIRALHAVEAYTPANIRGNISAPEVFIDKGVVFEGQVRMTDLDPVAV